MHFVRYKLEPSKQSVFLDFLHTYWVSDNQGHLDDAEYYSESNGGLRSQRRWPEDPIWDIFVFSEKSKFLITDEQTRDFWASSGLNMPDSCKKETLGDAEFHEKSIYAHKNVL